MEVGRIGEYGCLALLRVEKPPKSVCAIATILLHPVVARSASDVIQPPDFAMQLLVQVCTAHIFRFVNGVTRCDTTFNDAEQKSFSTSLYSAKYKF